MDSVQIELGDHDLDLPLLDKCLGNRLNVTLTDSGLARVRRGRAWVDEITNRDAAVYGINTGFGHLKNVRIPFEQLDLLQENLIISHAVGVGPPTPSDIVRWMLLFKTHMLLRGHSGVRPAVVERLAHWLEHDLLPVVPTRGSLGASGDLAPLAHLFLPLLGEGQMTRGDSPRDPRPAGALLAEVGLEPMRLAAKEGLALINGTQFMAAYGTNVVVRAARLIDLADLIYTIALEATHGSVYPADARMHLIRPHPGAQRSATNIRHHMRNSEILASHAACDKVQDPYSLRCAAHIHGAFRDTLTHVAAILQREINSVTDNPILFGPTDDDPNAHVVAISGGLFHGAPLAAPLDYLAIALTDLASLSERRTYLLLSGEDGLPKLLMRDTGLNSGYMIPQYTAAALVNECKVLSSPASVDTIPTSLGQEDHVSMGATSAVKLYEVLDRVEHVLAIELICATQALDFREPVKAGVGPQTAHDLVRQRIAHADRDRLYGNDIAIGVDVLRKDTDLLELARSNPDYDNDFGLGATPCA